MLKRIGLICCVVILVQTYYPLKTLQAAQLITLEEVIQRGLKLDQTIHDLQESVTKKKYEQTQAQEAIQDQAERDASSIAKPHSLSKDMDIVMKIPNARSGYSLALNAVDAKQRSVSADLTKLYTQVFQAMRTVPKVQLKLDKAKKVLKDTETKFKFGLATNADIKEAEKAVEQIDSEVKLTKLAYKNSKIELGERIGQNLEQDDFTFEIKPTYANLSQSLIWQLIHLTEQNDLELLTQVSNRKLAEEKVNRTRSLYTAKFGSAVMVPLNSIYKSQTVDTELLTTYYDRMLVDVKQQWTGFFLFPISTQPFVLSFPKASLQGEYDGLRYFDDIKYSLPISTLEMNKAKAVESDTRKSLILKVKKSYLDTKTAEEIYAQSLKAADEDKLTMKTADKKLKTGILSQAEYTKLQENTDLINENVVTNQLSYQAALTQLDLDTSGGLKRNIVSGILPWKAIDSGLDPLNKVPPVSSPIMGTWNITTIAKNTTVDFSIKVNSKLKATHYALMNADNQLLGTKLSINAKIRQLSFIFNDLSQLKVVLYHINTPIAVASIDGVGSKGELLQADETSLLTPKPTSTVKETGTLLIGTYKVKKEQLNNAILLAAQATLQKTGQGMYYNSEFSAGAWVNVGKATDLNSINTSKGAKAVKASEIEALAITININEDGRIVSMQTPAELQSELSVLTQSQLQLLSDKQVAVNANKTDLIASLSLQIKDNEAQIAFTNALIRGDATEAAKQIALMNVPEAALAALPSNSAEANAAAMEDLNKESSSLNTQLQQAQSAGNEELIKQLEATIAGTNQAQSLLQQKIDAQTAANLIESQEADAVLKALTEQEVKLESDLKLANEQADKSLTVRLKQSLVDLLEQIAAAEDKRDLAKTKMDEDASVKLDLPKNEAPSDEAKLAVLDQQTALLFIDLEQAKHNGQQNLVKELQFKLLQLEMSRTAIDSGLTQQLAVFMETKLSLQKLLDAAVKKGDSTAFDELKKLKASNDTALQLAEKSGLFMNKAMLENQIIELQAEGQKNGLIEQEIIKLTNQLVDNEKSKYSIEQLQQLATLTKLLKTTYPDSIQVLPVEKLLSQGVNIPLELPPVIIKGTTYIPIRPLSEAFNSTVVWDDAEQTVTITNDQTTIICQIDNPIASVNGNEVKLTEAPRLLEHRTIVPLRFIVESLGLSITWQDLTQTIEIAGLEE